jgi:circadian clock protein KaiB
VKIKQAKWKTSKRKERSAQARNNQWSLHLYVAGQTQKAVTTFNNLKLICEDHLKGNYHIKVIDLLKNPQIAHDDQIFAVPTLIRKFPLPEKNVIGDLSNIERVLDGLDLMEESIHVYKQKIKE